MTKRPKRRRKMRFSGLYHFDAEAHKPEVSFYTDRGKPASLRLTIRPRVGAVRQRARIMIRIALTVAETDYAVADLADALGYEVTTAPRHLNRPRLSFWRPPTHLDGTTIYMRVCSRSDIDGYEYVRVVVPLTRRHAQTLLNKIAEPLGWELYKG